MPIKRRHVEFVDTASDFVNGGYEDQLIRLGAERSVDHAAALILDAYLGLGKGKWPRHPAPKCNDPYRKGFTLYEFDEGALCGSYSATPDRVIITKLDFSDRFWSVILERANDIDSKTLAA